MDIYTFLEEKRSTILGGWYNLAIEVYPSDTQQFLRQQKDNFANPVGGDFREGLAGVLDALLKSRGAGLEREVVRPFLDRMIRIRALQKLEPSQGLSFVQGLKGLLRAALGKEAVKPGVAEELARLESAVDELLLFSFDIYAGCREELSQIKVRDEKRRLHMLLRRANLLCEQPDEPEIEITDLRNDGI
ncbi:MAG: RsbRD N-terminal domain-containing protein [Pseudomonadota bacterium]